MFDGARYVTAGVMQQVSPEVQRLLWHLIDKLKTETEPDYLQVFDLKEADGTGQKLIHSQEVPAYRAEYVFVNVAKPLRVKVYVIDDGEYCTMLLPEER
ncbi:MAG: DUF960 domain-containing protein [Negativicutes bacterium]|nr:DUF960 domain-containing protein [Negativicutes bacterium]